MVQTATNVLGDLNQRELWVRDLEIQGAPRMQTVLDRYGVERLEDLPVDVLRDLATSRDVRAFGGGVMG